MPLAASQYCVCRFSRLPLSLLLLLPCWWCLAAAGLPACPPWPERRRSVKRAVASLFEYMVIHGGYGQIEGILGGERYHQITDEGWLVPRRLEVRSWVGGGTSIAQYIYRDVEASPVPGSRSGIGAVMPDKIHGHGKISMPLYLKTNYLWRIR